MSATGELPLPPTSPREDPPLLFDIGVNLTSRQFGSDREAVIKRAGQAGVRRMLVLGTCVETSRAALQLTRDAGRSRDAARSLRDRGPVVSAPHPRLFASAGVHPHDAKDMDDSTIPALRELAAQPEVVAIGECGLDFDRNYSPREAQIKALEQQIELACELQMPLYLHDREASETLLERLRPVRQSLVGVVVHCFTGSAQALDAYLELDIHIGVTGWVCDERRGQELRELVARIPSNRLMLETDAPYLLPRTMGKRKSRRNEPAFLPWVLQTVAQERGVSPAELARSTSETAIELFGTI